MTWKTYLVIFCGALSILLALVARTAYKQAVLYTIYPDTYDHSPFLYHLRDANILHLLDRRSLLVTTSLSGELAGILFDPSLQDNAPVRGTVDVSTSVQHTTSGYMLDALLSGAWTMGEMSGTLLLGADVFLSGENLFLRLDTFSLSVSPELPYLLSQWYTIGRLRKDRWISLPSLEWMRAPERLLLLVRPRIQITRETPPYLVFSGAHEISFPGWYPTGILRGVFSLPDIGTIYTKSDRSLGPSLSIPNISHSLTLSDVIDTVDVDAD